MSLDSIIFLAPIDDLLIVLAHSFGQAPNGTWTYHSIIDNMEITGFQLTSGQAGSEHAAYQGIGGYWLSIGILSQQWGTADGTRGNFTTNLNVPYLNFYLPYASSTNTYGTDIWTVSARVETDLSKIGLSSEGNFEIIWLAIGM